MNKTKSASPARFQKAWPLLKHAITTGGSWLLVGGLAVAAYFFVHQLLPGGGHEEADIAETTASDAVNDQLVRLSPDKASEVKLQFHEVAEVALRPTRVFPGKVAFDPQRIVDIRAPFEAVVFQVLVSQGDYVLESQPLLKITGREIGAARVGIQRAEAALALAQASLQWADETNENVLRLIEVIKNRPPVEKLNEQFEGKSLGIHRTELMTAYSDWILAMRQLERSQQPDTQGVIPQKIIDQRQREIDVASAQLNGLIEETRFQTLQDLTRAQSDYKTAEKELLAEQEQLATLLGPFAARTAPKAEGGINELTLAAPRDGDIVEMNGTNGSRFQAGEMIVRLADTSQLRIEAQIPQKELPAVDLNAGDQVTVEFPNDTIEKFSVPISYCSIAVSETSLAVPLVLLVPNESKRLRPGMLVWVSVPAAKALQCIAVPESAVQYDDEKAFVFVRVDGSTFRPVPVSLGQRTDAMIEVVSGLKVGEHVVTEGAFFLKSEWLLEPE